MVFRNLNLCIVGPLQREHGGHHALYTYFLSCTTVFWIPAITALLSTKSPRTFEPSQSSVICICCGGFPTLVSHQCISVYSGFLPSLAVHAYQMDLHIAVVSHTGRTNSAAVGRSHGPDPLVDHEPTTLRLFRRLLTCQHPASTVGNVVTWVRKLMLHSFIRTKKTP